MKSGQTMRTSMLAIAVMAACGPTMAAGPAPTRPAKAEKPTPCPKGQVEITSKITGASRCAAMGGITMMWGGPGPQPIILPEKPAGKPKK
jgi:hypothetical protein